MKYLFWVFVMVLVWWAWRRSRSAGLRNTPPTEPRTQEMVICNHCGVHLPHNEAVSGLRGQYCSPAHRSAAGDRNPD